MDFIKKAAAAARNTETAISLIFDLFEEYPDKTDDEIIKAFRTVANVVHLRHADLDVRKLVEECRAELEREKGICRAL